MNEIPVESVENKLISKIDSLPFQSIHAKGVLSFGNNANAFKLGRLNVLIGPNGSGKSNLIDILSFLKACLQNITEPFLRSGGTPAWLFQGNKSLTASISTVVAGFSEREAFRHQIEFSTREDIFSLEGEEIFEIRYILESNSLKLYERPVYSMDPSTAYYPEDLIAPPYPQSVLMTRIVPERLQALVRLAESYSRISIYRHWEFGRDSILRQSSPADGRSDLLIEDFSNFSIFLGTLIREPRLKRKIINLLQDLNPNFTDISVFPIGGQVQLFITEGDYNVPATRLSDGSLRYLALIAILIDPKPKGLLCIEEPELGLHPDMLPKIAEMLVEASQQTQLIVTTHSDILVDALSETPESIVVCEKVNGETKLSRLSAEKLAPFLEKYRLGELWISGEIGGKRW